jgi:hypothetical protein
MRYIELFDMAFDRDHCTSQREASEILLERSPNYISQYREAEVSAEDGVRVWRKLVEKRDHELAARVLLSILEGDDE